MPSVRRFFPTVVFSFGSREVERRDSLFLDMIFWEKGLRKSLFSPASIFTRSFYCQWERSINNNEGFGFYRGFAIRGQPVILRKKRLGQIYTRLSRCSLYREQQFPGFPGSMTPAAARRGILLSFPPFGVLLGAGDV